MKIRTMHLENYRCFKAFDITFDDRLTVLVGVNGAGKTAVLDALSIFLKWAGHPNVRGANQPLQMPIEDALKGSSPENVRYGLEVHGSSSVKVKYENPEATYNNISFFHEESITNVIDILNHFNPLFVSYMANRSISEVASISQYSRGHVSPFSAYESGFNRTIDYASTLAWFHDMDGDEARDIRDGGEVNPILEAVKEAISKALLGNFYRPRMQGSPSELIIYEKETDQSFKVSQLSAGYRAMLTLVMDLARRMAQACPASLLRTPAIVLIDEVELHLHPSWQQTVLTTLMDIFPNTQFIVTTHSPQVLTSIPNKHIRILKDGKAYTETSLQTEGAEASQLLKEVFGVDLRPPDLDIVKELEKYKELVYTEQWDTPEAEALRKKLISHYGNYEPELDNMALHIENKKWEQSL